MTRRVVRALRILSEGPATSTEMGLEMSITAEKLAEVLAPAVRSGVVVVRPFEPLPGTSPKPVVLYALASYEQVAA